jgi:ArsR family transcriptional regulator, lead/cadmium/zinc/bismuth-responsive transcriptional repressor
MTDIQISTLCETATADDIAQTALLDVATANRLAEVFKAISDPTRLRIITLLMHHEVCVHVMEEALGMTQSAISHQLRVLRQLNLVRFRKEGRHVFYALDDDHVRILLEQGLMHITHG